MPIREAINRLIAERALEMLPNRSVVVMRMTRDKFIELSMLRQKLEGIATEEACRRATPALLKKLEKINIELLQSIEQKNISRSLKRNQEFHFEIYKASNYQLLVPMIESLWLQAGPFMYFSLSMPGVQWDASKHNDALGAMSRGDAVASRKAIEQDIRGTANFLLRSIEFHTQVAGAS